MPRALPLALALVLLTAQPSSTQDAPPDAATVLAWVQARHDATPTLHAHFEQNYWIRLHDRTMTSSGEVRIARPGRIRIDYARPRSQVAVSDGSRYVYYDPGDEGMPARFYRGTADFAAEFAILTGAHVDHDFTAVLHASASAPAHTVGIELRPRVPSTRYVRIRVYVSDVAETRGRIERIAIENHGGDWNRFDFTFSGDASAPIDDAVFQFSPPPGTREVAAPE